MINVVTVIIIMAPKDATTKTFIKVSFNENVSSNVSSFSIIKRRLLNKFSLKYKVEVYRIHGNVYCLADNHMMGFSKYGEFLEELGKLFKNSTDILIRRLSFVLFKKLFKTPVNSVVNVSDCFIWPFPFKELQITNAIINRTGTPLVMWWIFRICKI